MAADTTSTKLSRAQTLIQPGDSVLDIGCGPGRVLVPLAEQGIEITGLDTDVDVIAALASSVEHIPNAHTRIGSAERLPFDDNSFDTVLCFSTLCIVPNPETALREITRVLKPSGSAIIELHGSDNASFDYWRKYYADLSVCLHGYRLSEAKDLLRAHGFTISRIHGFGLMRALYYLPWTKALKGWDKLAFSDSAAPDLDYHLSNAPLLRRKAATWQFIARNGLGVAPSPIDPAPRHYFEIG